MSVPQKNGEREREREEDKRLVGEGSMYNNSSNLSSNDRRARVRVREHRRRRKRAWHSRSDTVFLGLLLGLRHLLGLLALEFLDEVLDLAYPGVELLDRSETQDAFTFQLILREFEGVFDVCQPRRERDLVTNESIS